MTNAVDYSADMSTPTYGGHGKTPWESVRPKNVDLRELLDWPATLVTNTGVIIAEDGALSFPAMNSLPLASAGHWQASNGHAVLAGRVHVVASTILRIDHQLTTQAGLVRELYPFDPNALLQRIHCQYLSDARYAIGNDLFAQFRFLQTVTWCPPEYAGGGVFGANRVCLQTNNNTRSTSTRRETVKLQSIRDWFPDTTEIVSIVALSELDDETIAKIRDIHTEDRELALVSLALSNYETLNEARALYAARIT